MAEGLLLDIDGVIVTSWQPLPGAVEALDAIIDESPLWLAPEHSALVCELAPHQARAAADRARGAGFTDVASVDTGVPAWRRAGLPIERGD